MSKYDNDAVRVIQLAVLSALVDGQASAEEIEAIADGVSNHFAIERTAVKTLAGKMVERYVSKKLTSNPISVLRHGKNAMRRLSGRNRQIAVGVAKQVAAASPGGEAHEAKFLRELVRVARA